MWGVVAPIVATAMGLGVVFLISPRPSIQWGVTTGLLLALLQSFASVGALQWAFHKSFFYWVWGGGVLVRFIVFAVTAFVVYRYTNLSLVATLISLVIATTLFLVIESYGFLTPS